MAGFLILTSPDSFSFIKSIHLPMPASSSKTQTWRRRFWESVAHSLVFTWTKIVACKTKYEKSYWKNLKMESGWCYFSCFGWKNLGRYNNKIVGWKERNNDFSDFSMQNLIWTSQWQPSNFTEQKHGKNHETWGEWSHLQGQTHFHGWISRVFVWAQDRKSVV